MNVNENNKHIRVKDVISQGCFMWFLDLKYIIFIILTNLL